ncbi:MAG: NAD-dependent epimerase/dehydratase [Bryobacterales bacterium]|nr:NAD-dependent epimerase/dehydratase [Bryobacterales bacterium]
MARLLTERGYKVRALVRGLGRVPELEVEEFEGDLRDPDSLLRAAEGCGLVFHVAADYRLWSKDPEELYRSNVGGTRNMLNAALAAGVERVVYTSTVGCIGIPEGGGGRPGIGDESTPIAEHSMAGNYKRSKFLAEQVALDFAGAGLPVVIVNPTAPMGDHDFKPTPTGAIVRDFLNGAMPAYIDTGLNVVNVRDVAVGHLLACEKGVPGERYILGCENMTLGQILAELARYTGRRAPRIQLPYAVAWTAGVLTTGLAQLTGIPPRVPMEAVRMAKKKMWVSHQKAAAQLGYAPSSPETAFIDAINWFEALP